MTSRKLEPWVAGVGGSVAIHALLAGGLLFALRAPGRAPVAPPSVVTDIVRLRVLDRPTPHTGPEAATSVAQPSKPHVSPRPAAETPKLEHLPVPDEPSSGVRTSERSTPTAEAALEAGAEGPGPAGLEGKADGNVPSGATSPGGSTEPHGGEPAAPSAELAASVHAHLSRVAKECYPERARRFRQTAQVPVAFCVGTAGQPTQVSVTPSGVEVLDEAARSCVLERAAPFDSAARGFCFAVKVAFGG